MAGRRPSAWQSATVVAIWDETASAKSFRLRLEKPSEHLAGQHCVVRLTAPDGYQASRAYSIASPPDGGKEIEITVERLPQGEVSVFLHDEVAIGDELEIRSPIGGFFVWDAESPALLIGGGSGVVPLIAMYRLARNLDRTERVRLIVSVRRPEDLYYAAELRDGRATVVYTRSVPPGVQRPAGRLSLEDVAPRVPDGATAYICGSSAFADHAGALAVAAGVPLERVRVERFGPSS
ncbi:MAG: oxidoreductase [Acidimicrobiaceae bacterium]|nr:oxidoreductase [Acidimicrobiaceae bacterium]